MKKPVIVFAALLFAVLFFVCACGTESAAQPDYVITYEYCDGRSGYMQTIKAGESLTRPDDPVRTGFAFEGWFSDAGYENEFDFLNTTVAENITLYAKWTLLPPEKAVRILLITNGGVLSGGNLVSINAGEEFEPPLPEKAGYDFLGWYTDAGFTVEYDSSSEKTGNMSLYAKWQIKTFNLLFNQNNGNAPELLYADYGTLINPPDIVKPGYIFDGWYTDETYTATFDFDTAVSSDITLYAKWAAIVYTVTFDSGNGDTETQQLTVESGFKASIPNIPIRAGYIFDGWYTDETYTATFDFDAAVSSDITLYAKWSAVVYTVTFDTGDDTEMQHLTVESGFKASIPDIPIRTGYIFDGWYIDETSTAPFVFDAAVSSDITLYAKWSAVVYTVTFDTGDDTEMQHLTVESDFKASIPNMPIRAGYIFNGWYTDETHTAPFDFNAAVSSDITLYAKWSAVVYTVTFDSGGSNEIDTQGVVKENNYIISEPPKPLKSGYYFEGWYIDRAFSAQFNFHMPISSSLTLYAKWAKIVYTVEFDSNSGSAVSLQELSIDNDFFIVLPEAPHKTGYTFQGWFSNKNLTAAFDPYTAVTSDIVLYAKWSKTVYTLVFDFRDGRQPQSLQVDIDCGFFAEPPEEPERTGYTFGGWYTDRGSNYEFDFIAPVNNNQTLYAKWTIIYYTVSFITSGSPAAPIELEYNTTLTALPETFLQYHTFDGWYVSADETAVKFNINTAIVQNLTLYSRFTRQSCTVSFYGNTGNGQVVRVLVFCGETISATLIPAPSASGAITPPDGLSFTGWYTSDEGNISELFNFATLITADINLYAGWRQTFRAVFYSDTTTLPDIYYSVQDISPNSRITPPVLPPEKTHYTFEGWATVSGGTSAFDFSTSVNQDYSFYPIWNRIVFTVVFKSNGLEYKSVNVYSGDTVGTVVAPVLAGNVFEGWYYFDSAQAKIFIDNISAFVPESHMTIFAHHREVKTFTVVLKARDYSLKTKTYTVTEGEAFVAPALFEGFETTGWFYENGSAYSDSKVTADLILYAALKTSDGLVFVESHEGYTVSCGNFSGSNLIIPRYYGNPSMQVFALTGFNGITVENILLPEGMKILERDCFKGAIFKNILLPKTLTTIKSGAFESAGWKNAEIIIPSSVTLLETRAFYACLLKKIAFASGSTLTSLPYEFAAHSLNLVSVSLCESITYLGGYSFAGCIELFEISFNPSAVLGKSVFAYCCLYRNDSISYEIIFNSYDGYFETLTFLQGYSITPPEFSLDGFAFVGWTTGDTVLVDFENYICTAPMSFYAVWSKNKLTVTYIFNNGKDDDFSLKLYAGEYAENLDAEYEGRTFYGWTEEDTDGLTAAPGLFDFDTAVSGDIVLRAVYTSTAVVSYSLDGKPFGDSSTVTLFNGGAVFTLPDNLSGFEVEHLSSENDILDKSIILCGDIEIFVRIKETEGLSYTLLPAGNGYRVGIGTSGSVNIVIPSTYNSLPVTEIAPSGFANSNIVSVLLPSSVYIINAGAFKNCLMLESINTENITYWCAGAFENCVKLGVIALTTHNYLSSAERDEKTYENVFTGAKIKRLIIYSENYGTLFQQTYIETVEFKTSIVKKDCFNNNDSPIVTAIFGVEVKNFESFCLYGDKLTNLIFESVLPPKYHGRAIIKRIEPETGVRFLITVPKGSEGYYKSAFTTAISPSGEFFENILSINGIAYADVTAITPPAA